MPSIAELRSALGAFAKDKNDEQLLQFAATTMGVSPGRIASEYGYKPTSSGIAGLRTGASIDQYQAGLYGLGEAITGADFFRRGRQANEFESNVALERARDQGAIGSFEEVQGLSDVPSYLGGLAIGSAPYMVEALGGGLAARGLMTGTRAALGAATAGGDAAAAARAAGTLRAGQTAGGVAAAYPSAVGGILQAQREQAGETDLGAAAALGVPFAALNALGIEGALARQQMARSGISALDNLQGFSGGLARAGATGVRTGLVEGGTETLQEMTSQLGRMAVDPNEAFLSDAALGRYKESAIGGALLGGTFGGATGFGRSEGYRAPMAERDLTQTKTSTVQTPAPRTTLTGLDTAALMGSPYANANLLGGGYPNQPLVTSSLYNQEADLTAPAGTTTAAAGVTKPTTPSIFSETDTALNKLGVKPTKNSRGIYDYLVAEGIDPASPEAEPVMNALAASKVGEARKAVGEIIRARSTRGTGISTVQQPAGGLGVGSPVVQGTVGDAGRVAPVAGTVVGGAPAAGAPLQQTGLLPSTAGQPSTPITTGALSGPQASQTIEAAPQGQTTTTVPAATPIKANTTLRLNQQEKLQDNVLGELKQELAALEGQTQPSKSDLSRMQELRDQIDYAETNTQLAEQRDFTEADLNDLIDEQLGKGKNKERDRKILRAYILSRRMETEGAKGDLVEEIANTFGITEDRVRQIGNPEKLAKLAVEKGFGRNQVFDLLGIQSAQKALATELGKLEGELTRLKAKAKPSKADTARMAELDEQITRINDAAESGDMAAAFKEAGIESEAGEAFGTLDDSREWQKASTAGSQMAVRLVSIADTLAELKAAAAELQQLGLAQAEAAATARIEELTAEYEAIMSGYEAKPEAEATAPKKGKGKGKAAEKAAEEKDAAKEAEAAKFRAERAAKLQADRNGLAVGDTVKNPKLGTGVVKSFAGDGDATTVTVAFQSGQTKELSVKLAKLEKTDAVQVESTTSVPVQPKAETGEKVGRQVRRAPKPATEGKAQVPAVILTQAEQAAQAWDVVAADFPEAPKFADLTKAQQNTFIEFGPDNWERGDVELELTKLAKGGMKFGTEAAPKADREPYTAKQLLAELKAFIRADIPKRKLMVVGSVADLLTSPDAKIRAVGAGLQLQGAYGVAVDGRAFLVANRIQQGSGRAKFMHEVGGHLGLDNLLTKADQDKLVNQIKSWAKKADGSLEAELALQAFERVVAAQTPKEDQRSELIAYFIESAMEMGVDPTAATDTKLSGPLREWFRTLWAAFKVAARKLGIKPESMTAQDVVNLAYGAARLEINGTWHGTAASFRNFRNKYIGSGEGATAYGWGTYLAQRVGIAKGYWSADVGRKTGMPTATYDGRPIEELMAELDAKEFEGGNGLTADEESLRTVLSDLSLNLGVGDNNALRNANMTIAKRGASGSFTSKRYKQASDWLDKNYAKFKVVPGKQPEGNLMRVDTAVNDERVFNYDTLVIKQPNYVADKLMELLDPVADEILDRTNKDVEELTGRDLIGTGENDLGLLSNLIMDDAISLPAGKDKQFDEAVRQGKFHEAASHFLRASGIQGIKFYDARSRGSASTAISFDGKTYNRDELRDKSREASQANDAAKTMQFLMLRDILRNGVDDVMASLEEKVSKQADSYEQIYLDSAARYNVKVNPAEERVRAEKEANETFAGQQLAWLKANEKLISIEQLPKLRNLIIFNDKDIFRVGGEAAADRQRMKFGKNMPAQGLIDRNIAKLPKQSQQPVKNLTAAIGDLGGKYLDYAVFTNDLVKRAQALGLGAAKTFSDRLAARNAKVSEEERKIEKIADRYALIEDANKGSGPGSVNEFLFESTRTGKWGYDTAKFKADPAMKAMFDKLGPKAQQFVKDVFAHGDATLSNKKTIVLNATNSEYDAMIKAAQDLVNTATDSKVKADAEKELAKLKAEKAATLKRFQTLFRIREGIPYAPIKRTGAYVVIGESAEYKAAKANKDTATVKKLESDPDHYHVSFVDTKWQARNLKDNLAEQGVFDSPQIVKRSESFDEAFSGEAMLPALTKMRAAVDRRAQDANGKKDPTAGKLLNIINQLYLEALAEGSARKSEMRRRGVAGEVDMLQSFTQQGRADANFLASVEFEPKIQDALQQMRNQSRTGDRERKSEIFDELTQRYADSLEPKNNPFINGLTNMASKFFLASSPGYYLQNLTQPFMMSLPAMAGRHDYTKAAAALAKAYTELGPLFKDVKLFDQQFDFSKVPADVRTAINDLVNQGKIDIGLATEINEYKVEADGKISKFAQRLNKGMRLAVQKVEATNRLSTAIAAYRLEFERAKKDPKIADPKAAATQYAADILTETHGDYTAFNAPRAFNTQWGKVALQFRKFQLIQIAFYTKLIRDAFTKPDERAAAMKTLGYSLGHTAVFAGMMGLPGYAAIAAILGAFGDEDEPYDLTAEMRKALGPEWADMIMRGAPTLVGMDLSGKIGAGNMLSIMPFSDADLSTNAGRAEAFGTLMGGAALGMASRVVDGLGLIASGDYYKGIERTMPKGVSDALKAGRQAAEGMTRRNGDVVLPDSEISAIDTVMTGLGVPAVKQAVTYERQNRMRDITENFQDRTTRIKNDYTKAVREKDTEGMAEARAAWTKLQQTRQRNGLTPQPVSSLLKAPQEQRAREQRTVGGVQYREGQRKLAESVAEN